MCQSMSRASMTTTTMSRRLDARDVSGGESPLVYMMHTAATMIRHTLYLSCLTCLLAAGCIAGDADQRFEEFLVEHQSCERDDQCVIIGDCGPNADVRAVRIDEAEEAYRLMRERDVGVYDGLTYTAVCREGLCGTEQDGYACGGLGGPPPPLDHPYAWR